MTSVSSWLAAQNAQGPFPFPPNEVDSTARFIRNGRDLAALVHAEVPFEEYLTACLWLSANKTPFNPGNPYLGSLNQSGFTTFGFPHIESLPGEVCIRALKAVWYQKWFVHRTLRPEEFAGRLHFKLAGQANYAIHPDVLNSKAVNQAHTNNGTNLLPQAYPEGCPQHPSYAQGHGTLVGACATIMKAFFDGTQPFTKFSTPVQPDSSGTALMPYSGSDVDQMTVGSELDKLASNIGQGRNFAGVHWRSDYAQGLLLGEAVAISILRDQRATYTEDFRGFTLTKFDGTVIIV